MAQVPKDGPPTGPAPDKGVAGSPARDAEGRPTRQSRHRTGNPWPPLPHGAIGAAMLDQVSRPPGAPRNALCLRCRHAAAAVGGAGRHRHRAAALAAVGRARQPRHPQPLPRLGARPLLADAVDRGDDRRASACSTPRCSRWSWPSYLPFLAVSLIVWNTISQIVTDACTSLTSAEGIIRQLPLPYSVHMPALRLPQRHHRRAQPADHPAGLPRHRHLAGLGGAAGHPRAGAARPAMPAPWRCSSACSAPASATSRRSSAA